MSDIRTLDGVKKGVYVDQMLKEQDATMAYVQVVENTVLEKETEAAELIWAIADMNDTYETAMDDFEAKINEKIGELGVNKNSYETKFKLLDI